MRSTTFAQIASIARFTYLEVLRSRFLWLLLVGLITLLGFSEFIKTISVTEASWNRAAVFAATVRWFLVVITSLFVATSMVREFNDKVLDMMLSLPIARGAYYCGKLLGYVGVAMSCSLLTGAVLLALAPLEPVVIWTLSLTCELVLLIAVALLCLVTFNQLTAAVSIVFSFYILARSIDAIQLMGHGPLVVPTEWSSQIIAAVIDGLAYLLPTLSRFTSAEWLLHGTDWSVLGAIVLQTLIYITLLAGATLFDLHRKNF